MPSTFYAAPQSTGTGATADAPAALADLVGPATPLKPGDTLLLRGGTYPGNFHSVVRGTPALPVTVGAFPGELPLLDGATDWAGLKASGREPLPTLRIDGGYTRWFGVGLTNSSPTRDIRPDSLPHPMGMGLANYAPGTVFANAPIYFNSMGVGDWWNGDTPSDTEIYGCVIFGNGFLAQDRAHGHAIYGQNTVGRKRYQHNVLVNQFGNGFQLYGSPAARFNGFEVLGNDVSGAGVLHSPTGGACAILIGGARGAPPAAAPLIHHNTTHGPGCGLNLGYDGGTTDAVVADNFLDCPTSLAIVNATRASLTGNVFRGGLVCPGPHADPNVDNYRMPHPAPGMLHVRVRPNKYQRGRANVVVFSAPDGPASVAVDLSSAGLVRGQPFEVRSGQDFLGHPVAGVYTGAPVAFPMNLTSVAVPPGNPPFVPPAWGCAYGSFIVLPGPVPGAPTP